MIDRIKKYLWLFPFIGSIITIISFATPAVYFIYRSPTYDTEFYRWMLDFYFSHVYELGVDKYTFHQSTSFTGYISIFASITIIISNIFIILSVRKYRKENLEFKKNWLILALITISLTIGWMIMKEISTIISFGHSFWGLLSPSFGIIGPFIGGSLVVLGYIFYKLQLKNNKISKA